MNNKNHLNLEKSEPHYSERWKRMIRFSDLEHDPYILQQEDGDNNGSCSPCTCCISYINP